MNPTAPRSASTTRLADSAAPAPRSPRGRLGRALRTALASSVAVASAFGAVAATARLGVDVPLVVTQVPQGAKGPAAGWDARSLGATDWYAGARIVFLSPDGQARVLSEGFDTACDPSVSFDGQHVLFSGRKTRSATARIWEIGVDGQGLRPVTPEDLDARSPIYVSTLFTLNSPEPWFTTVFVARNASLNELGRAASSSLYNIKLDGGELRRLTFNPNLNADPFQTWDGHVIYAAERYPNEPGAARGRFGLYATHMEGADTEFYGGELGRRVQRMPCATAGGLVVFVEGDQPSWDGSGQLGCVEQRRPHLTYRPLTKDAAFVYLHPAPLAGNEVLVARRGTRGKGTWGIVRFDADTGKAAAVFDDPAFHEVQAVVAQPHRRPDGHSTIVNTQVDFGVLYGLNSYTMDPKRAGQLRAGEIKRVRLIEGVLPASTSDATPAEVRGPYIPRRLIGEAPVEPDGSFSLELPADTPMLLQTVDERGLALDNCGWIWVKPRENRGCIGCHEDPELVPENDFVMALRRPPTPLRLPAADRKSISFRETIAPILQQHCATAECHGAKTTPLRLRLSSPQATDQELRDAYDALLVAQRGASKTPPGMPVAGKYVDAGRARTSRLVWQLTGADTSRPWDHAGSSTTTKHKITLMPPAGTAPPLSAEELQAVIQWIDMGAPFEPVHAAEISSTKTEKTP